MKIKCNLINFNPPYYFSNVHTLYDIIDYPLALINDRKYKYRNDDDQWRRYQDKYVLVNFRLLVIYEIYRTGCIIRDCNLLRLLEEGT